MRHEDLVASDKNKSNQLYMGDGALLFVNIARRLQAVTFGTSQK